MPEVTGLSTQPQLPAGTLCLSRNRLCSRKRFVALSPTFSCKSARALQQKGDAEFPMGRVGLGSPRWPQVLSFGNWLERSRGRCSLRVPAACCAGLALLQATCCSLLSLSHLETPTLGAVMLCILPLKKVIKEKEMKSPGTPEHQICASAVYFCDQRRLALVRRF